MHYVIIISLYLIQAAGESHFDWGKLTLPARTNMARMPSFELRGPQYSTVDQGFNTTVNNHN